MSARKVRHLAVIADDRVVGLISDSEIFLQLMRFASDPSDVVQARTQTEKIHTASTLRTSTAIGEKRKFERLNTTIKIAYKLADAEGKTLPMTGRFCTCLNVSLGGMLLEVDELLPLKHLVVMAFEIPGSGVPIKRLARVSRVSPGAALGHYQTGVMFLALSVKETSAMQQLLNTLRPHS